MLVDGFLPERAQIKQVVGVAEKAQFVAGAIAGWGQDVNVGVLTLALGSVFAPLGIVNADINGCEAIALHEAARKILGKVDVFR